MSDSKDNTNFEEKYNKMLDRYTKMHIEIQEFENAYQLLSNEINMLQCEKEYLLDILCEIEDSLLKHKTLAKVKSQSASHYRRSRLNRSVDATLMNGSEKLYDDDMKAVKASFDMLNEQRKKYNSEREHLEGIINNWDHLTNEEKQNYRELVNNQSSFLQSPMPTEEKEDIDMSTKEEAMRSTSYTPMFSDDESSSPYTAHRKYNEQEASPIPQDSSDPSTNVSPITTPCKSSLNDKHSSQQSELIKSLEMNPEKLSPASLDVDAKSDLDLSERDLIELKDTTIKSSPFLTEQSAEQSPRLNIKFTRKPSTYETAYPRRGSIASIAHPNIPIRNSSSNEEDESEEDQNSPQPKKEQEEDSKGEKDSRTEEKNDGHESPAQSNEGESNSKVMNKEEVQNQSTNEPYTAITNESATIDC